MIEILIAIGGLLALLYALGQIAGRLWAGRPNSDPAPLILYDETGRRWIRTETGLKRLETDKGAK